MDVSLEKQKSFMMIFRTTKRGNSSSMPVQCEATHVWYNELGKKKKKDPSVDQKAWQQPLWSHYLIFHSSGEQKLPQSSI